MKHRKSKKLSAGERRLILLLGIPGMGLSQALTVLSTYLPVLARRMTTSRAIIGGLVGGEGLVAVVLPLWIGGLSDRVDTRFGRRLPFLMVTAPVAALALVLIPFASSLLALAVLVFLFYLAYFTFLAPYRALYADLVSPAATGRAQGIQGLFSSLGLGTALIGGGLLLEVWRPLPYLLAAATLLLVTVILALGLRRAGAMRAPHARVGEASLFTEVWSLLRDHRELRAFAIANALLQLGIGGLKAFVVLWLTEGLGKSMDFTALMMAVLTAGVLAGSFVTGRLADHYGTSRVLAVTLTVFGAGLFLPALSSSTILLGAAFPIIAFSGGATIALPYALLLPLMPSGKHGATAGLYDVSSGMGTLLGPALTGAAIDLLHPFFVSTKGYAGMWPVLGTCTLASVVLLRRVRTPRHLRVPDP
jgi:MFS family permease